MAEQNENLPEGTDKVIAGASVTTPDSGVSTTAAGSEPLTSTTAIAASAPGDDLVIVERSGSSKVGDRVRSGREKLSGQAADKARGLVAQGIDRSAEALANVSRMIGDTAAGIDERLGEEYGDYARRAASTIESTANSLAAKDADELIDDTRDFVRKSPGVALAGAAILGFAVARLVKTSLGGSDDEGSGRKGKRKA